MKTRVLVVALLVSIATLVAAPNAWADDTTCVGLVMGVHDNVVVPPGATCTLTSSTVAGSVLVQENAKLFAQFNMVQGNIIGDKAEVMDLDSNTLFGVISITEGDFNDPELDVRLVANDVRLGGIKVEKMTGEIVVGVAGHGNSVNRGNIFLQENRPVAHFEVNDNTVGQNIQVFKTFGPGVPKTVVNNRAGENLQCFENDPPFIGGPNPAPKKEGQCF
jgi:hypothetical protein